MSNSEDNLITGGKLALFGVIIFITDIICMNSDIPSNNDLIAQFFAVALAFAGCGFTLRGTRSKQ